MICTFHRVRADFFEAGFPAAWDVWCLPLISVFHGCPDKLTPCRQKKALDQTFLAHVQLFSNMPPCDDGEYVACSISFLHGQGDVASRFCPLGSKIDYFYPSKTKYGSFLLLISIIFQALLFITVVLSPSPLLSFLSCRPIDRYWCRKVIKLWGVCVCQQVHICVLGCV